MNSAISDADAMTVESADPMVESLFFYDSDGDLNIRDDNTLDDTVPRKPSLYGRIRRFYFRNMWPIRIAAVTGVLLIVVIGLSAVVAKNKSTQEKAASSQVFLAPPPNDIDEVCLEDNLARSGGRNACRDICRVAGCCFLPVELSCLTNSKEECEQYAPACEVFFANVEVPPAPDDIAEICSLESLTTTEDGFVECESICLRAECCATSSEKESCKKTNGEVCEEYDPCNILDTWKDGTPAEQIQVSPTAVDYLTKQDEIIFVGVACTQEKVSTASGRKACQDFCEETSCCIDDTCDDPENVCDGFESCSILDKKIDYEDEPDEEVGTDSEETDSAVDPELMKGMIAETCNKDMFDVPEDFNDCKAFCSFKMCCFDEGSDSCKDDKKDTYDCSVYDSCKILLESENEETVVKKVDEGIDPDLMKGMVAETCNEDMFDVPEDFNDCKTMCEQNMCCFAEGSENCEGDLERKYDCSVYDSCKILLSYETEEPEEDNQSFEGI